MSEKGGYGIREINSFLLFPDSILIGGAGNNTMWLMIDNGLSLTWLRQATEIGGSHDQVVRYCGKTPFIAGDLLVINPGFTA